MKCTSAANAGFPIDREHSIKKHRQSDLGFTSDIICIVRLGRDDSFHMVYKTEKSRYEEPIGDDAGWNIRGALRRTNCPVWPGATGTPSRRHSRSPFDPNGPNPIRCGILDAWHNTLGSPDYFQAKHERLV